MTLTARLKLQRQSGFSLDVDLTFPAGQVTALYGHSGAGKSTVLRLLAGLETGGPGDQIHVVNGAHTWQAADQFVPTHARGIGFVFQQPQLLPHLNVANNLRYALNRRRLSQTPSLDTVVEWLQINHLLKACVTNLSGGEAQRVAIARALLSDARLLLLDEPLGALDYPARQTILPCLQQLRGELDIPIVYVSHSLEEITTLADQLYLLERGRIRTHGSVFELASSLAFNTDQGDQVAAVVTCHPDPGMDDQGLTRLRLGSQFLYAVLPDSAAQQTTMRLRIPARDVSLALDRPRNTSILNVLRGEIEEIEAVSEQPNLLVRIRVEDQHLLTRITRKSLSQLALAPGQHVHVQIKSVALLHQFLHRDMP